MKNTHVLPVITLSDKVVVSDPCYKRGTECVGTLENVKPGEWVPALNYYKDKEDCWGTRVKDLLLAHKEHISTKWEKQEFTVGVDSGQCGVFCDTIYPQGEPGEYGDKGSFYGICCEATLGKGYNDRERYYHLLQDKELAKTMLEQFGEKYGMITYWETKRDAIVPNEPPIWHQGDIVFGKGVVSSSGYGDGSYTCFVQRSKEGQITAIKVKFI